MFLINKYSKWYNNIVQSAKNRSCHNGYTETHHIIPRSMGGNDQSSNLVKLTAKEHFICHLLLPKMVSDQQIKYKLHSACYMMSVSSKNQKRYTSKSYHIFFNAYRKIVSYHHIMKLYPGHTWESIHNEIENHYRRGLTTKEIGKIYNVGQTAILNRLKVIKQTNPDLCLVALKNKNQSKPLSEASDKITQMYECGKTIKEIAIELNSTWEIVRRVLRENNVIVKDKRHYKTAS